MAKPKPRTCRWCKLTLDKAAPPFSEMVAGPKRQRRVRPHCGSPTCDWCLPCFNRRSADGGPPTQEIPAVTDDDPPIEPDRMT